MKNKVFHHLKKNKGSYVSGESLSEILGVSRTAVWKHINELKKEGYVIESTSRKGYRLVSGPDILNPFEIGYNLETKILGSSILYFDVIDSTNNYAKKVASEGCKDGTVIIAESQIAGRGRLGRTWDSSDKKGIWMSVILKPLVAPEDVQIITLAASVAVVSAINQISGIKAGIKWPNDIIIEGRKVCGILTEMSTEMEQVNFLVIGIGLNVNHESEDFPSDIKDKAISLKMAGCRECIAGHGNFDRIEIIKRILCELERIYSKITNGTVSEIISEWKQNSVTLGKEVKVSSRERQYSGIAIDITDEGKLIVKCTDGVTREISTGEIAVKGALGYA